MDNKEDFVMDKKGKLIFFGCMFGGIAFALLMLTIVTKGSIFKSRQKEVSYEQGTVESVNNTVEGDVATDASEYVPERSFTSVENMSIVENILTLNAISQFDKQFSDWLVEQGYNYSSIMYFTINRSSVVTDKSYPYFELIQDTEQDDTQICNKTIRATYDLPNYQWKFSFKY